MSDNLFFYSSCENSGNFGDLLSTYLYTKITGRKANHYIDKKIAPKKDEPHYFMIGSILKNANNNSIIWGSGFISKTDRIELQNSENIKCVRGPRTKKMLEKKFSENEFENIGMGDPGLLVSLFYNPFQRNKQDQNSGLIYRPNVDKKFQIGIVPHLNDLKTIKEKYFDNTTVKIINLYCHNLDDIERVIDEICSCQIILSSSLHGLITAQSYNIPAFWFKEKYIPGDDIKFYDYFESVYQEEYTPKIENNDIMLNISEMNYKYPDLIFKRMNDLFFSCPLLENKTKIIYFISNSKSYNHQIGALLRSSYRYQMKFVNFNETIDYNKDDVYFISCLLNSHHAQKFIQMKKEGIIKNLIGHSTGNVDFLNIELLNLYDVIFYETDYTFKRSNLKYHKCSIKSFGIDTEMFNTREKADKKYDYIWVGSINDSLKKFSKIREMCEVGSKILMIGDFGSDRDRVLFENLKEYYSITQIPRTDLNTLSFYYKLCETCILTQPEYGGGERCLLEAKYLGLEIKISQNQKLQQLLEDEIIYDLDYFSKQIDLGLSQLMNI